MIFSIFILLALVVVAIGSFTDIKTLEVPDWLNYSLIAAGIGVNIIFSLANSDPSFMFRSFLGLGIALLLGLLMFYTGQWGGGDSKMIFGLGAMLGFDYSSFSNILMTDFFTKFLVNMLFAGALYGIAWIIYMSLKNAKSVGKKASIALHEKNLSRIRLFSGIFTIAGIAFIFFIPVQIDATIKIAACLLLIMIYFMNYAFVFVKAVEDVSMIKLVEPEKLTEGDWIVENIEVDGVYITGPKDLGIEKSKIEKLIALKSRGKVDKIKVKYGIPFVPSFLIALVYTMATESIVLVQLLSF